MWLALVGGRLRDRNADSRSAFLGPDRQRDRQDAVGEGRLGATAAHRPGYIDLPVRRPHRPLVLEVVLLLLRISRFRIDGQLPTLQANLHGVVVRARDRDGHGDLIVGLVEVDRRCHRDQLAHKTSSNTRLHRSAVAFSLPLADGLTPGLELPGARGYVVVAEPLVQGVAEDAIGVERPDRALERPGKLSRVEYYQYVADLVNYLAYMAEPEQASRKQWGILVLFFLAGFFVLTLLLKKEYWKDVK